MTVLLFPSDEVVSGLRECLLLIPQSVTVFLRPASSGKIFATCQNPFLLLRTTTSAAIRIWYSRSSWMFQAVLGLECHMVVAAISLTAAINTCNCSLYGDLSSVAIAMDWPTTIDDPSDLLGIAALIADSFNLCLAPDTYRIV